LQTKNKKRTSEAENPLALQSPENNTIVISSIDVYLGFDKSFFVRGANDTEPRNHPTS